LLDALTHQVPPGAITWVSAETQRLYEQVIALVRNTSGRLNFHDALSYGLREESGVRSAECLKCGVRTSECGMTDRLRRTAERSCGWGAHSYMRTLLRSSVQSAECGAAGGPGIV
jgi:hypothetical protein